MPDVLGEARVAIRTHDAGFASELDAKVKAAAAGISAAINVHLDQARLDAQFAELEAKTKAAGTMGGIGVPAHLDETRLNAELAELPVKTKAAAAAASAETKVTADTTQARGAIGGLVDYARTKLNEFSGSVGPVKRGLGEIEKAGIASGEGIKAAALGTGVLLLAFAALGAKGVADLAKVGAEVRKVKAATGETAEEASRLRNVGAGLGVDADTIGSGFFKLSQRIKDGGSTLAEYGIEVHKTNDGHTDSVRLLADLGEAYRNTQDPIARNQLLMAAFGKSGAELRPILSATRSELEQMAGVGPILHDKDLQNTRDMAIAGRELKSAVQEAVIPLGRALVPILTDVAHFAQFAAKGLEAVDSAIGGNLSNIVGFGVAFYAVNKAIDLGSKALAAFRTEEVATAEVTAATGASGAAAGAGLSQVAAGAGVARLGVIGLATAVAYRAATMDKDAEKQKGWLEDLAGGIPIISDAAYAIDNSAKFLGIESTAHQKAGGSAADHARSEQDLATAAQDVVERTKAEEKALQDLASAQEGAIDKALGLEHAQRAVTRANESVTNAENQLTDARLALDDATRKESEAIRDHGRSSQEARDAQDQLRHAMESYDSALHSVRDAHDGVKDSLIALAQSQRDNTVAQMEASGVTVDAQAKAAIYRQDLLALAQTVADPLRTQIIGLANNIREVPQTHNTTLNVDNSQALPALAATHQAIDVLPRDKFVDVIVRLFGQADLDRALRTADAISASVSNDITKLASIPAATGRMAGGPVVPGGTYDVGESRAERLVMFPGGGGYVYPDAPTTPVGGDGASAGGVVISGPLVALTVQVPPGAGAGEAVAALRAVAERELVPMVNDAIEGAVRSGRLGAAQYATSRARR